MNLGRVCLALTTILLLAVLATACGAETEALALRPEPPTPTPLPLPTVAPSPTAAPTQAPTAAPASAPTEAMPMAETESSAMGGAETVVNVSAKETDSGIIFTVDKSAVPAGKVKFLFKNEGKLTHELMVYPLQDLSEMMNLKREDKDVDEMEYIKGIAGEADEVDPGQSATVEATLAPGLYELACHVPGKNKDGASFTHFGKGQFFTLAVTGSRGPSADIAAPSNTMNVKMVQGTGDLASSWLFVPDKLVLKAGDVTFNVVNNEKEEHDFAVYPLADTTDFVIDLLKGGMEPEYERLKGKIVQQDLAAGKSVTKTLKLTPGVYAAVCYMVSKNADGTSFVHMERGQRFTFTVR